MQGASFATFEMRQVLQTVLREVELRPAEPAGERMTRRGITFTPAGQAAAVVVRRLGAGAAAPGSRSAPEPAAIAS
jgi:hypothetical protein